MIKKILLFTLTIVVLLFIGSVFYQAFQPKPFNWDESYAGYDREPFGAYVFISQLPNLFPGNKVKRLGQDDLTIYYPTIQQENYYVDEYGDVDSSIYLSKMSEDWDIPQFNVIALSEYIFLDDLNKRALLLHLYQGNHALIVSYDSGFGNLLGIETETSTITTEESEKYEIELLDKQAVNIPVHAQFSKITSYPDSAKVIARNLDDEILGVELKVGEGSLIYFSSPILFTNYYLLKHDQKIVEDLVSMLPNRDTYWNNVIVGGKTYKKSKSLLSFIHSHESLTWAFYVLIFGVLIYLIFQIKREQRAVPVIPRPQNVSLKFTEVLSNLYLMKKDHHDIMVKKMTYFLEHIRTYYNLDTGKIDDLFFERLSHKSKVDLKTIRLLFVKYDRLSKSSVVDDEDFLEFNKLIQNFKIQYHE